MPHPPAAPSKSSVPHEARLPSRPKTETPRPVLRSLASTLAIPTIRPKQLVPTAVPPKELDAVFKAVLETEAHRIAIRDITLLAAIAESWVRKKIKKTIPKSEIKRGWKKSIKKVLKSEA